MPARPLLLAFGLTLAAVLSVSAYTPPPFPAPRPFRFAADRFAFANETVWNYVGGEVRSAAGRTPEQEPRYTRRCFVVTRAAVQFWKFARFAPGEKPLSDAELAERIRQVTGHPVWEAPLPEARRVAFPGYADLHALSAAHAKVFEDNIGLGWPVYFRMGNFPISLPVSDSTEERLNGEIGRDLAAGYPTILWLYNFPSLNINHVVVVYGGGKRGGQYVYRVYDPNYADAPRQLTFDPAAKKFVYPPTFYFKGGSVTARAVYRGHFQ